MRSLLAFSWLLSALLPSLGSSEAWAGFSTDIEVRGKVEDFDQDTVTLNAQWVRMQVKRKHFPKELDLRPGKQVVINLEFHDFLNDIHALPLHSKGRPAERLPAKTKSTPKAKKKK